MGADAGDDAAVWRSPDGRLQVATADFFGPLVDDPHLWGQIAAANAASDIFAMGAEPTFALNLVCWPEDALALDVLAEVLAGGDEVARRGGWLVAGGHTVTGAEPLYGQAVFGQGDPERLLTLAGAQPDDRLVLTKPLGSGIVTTAAMRREVEATQAGGDLHLIYRAATGEMLRLNDVGAQVAGRYGARAATDITGFGLLGHLLKLCRASGVSAELDTRAVPILDGTEDLAQGGFVPGGADRNLEFVREALGDVIALDAGDAGDTAAPMLSVLADPQTSGGLLLALPAETADDAVGELFDKGHRAGVIGHLR